MTSPTALSLSADSENIPLPSNATRLGTNVYCHESMGEHFAAKLPDCQRVLEIIQTYDIAGVGDSAVFSWDRKAATVSAGDIYITPKTIARGNCEVTVRLNGVRSVRALWGSGIKDAFGQLMKMCVSKHDTGGFTFVQRTGNGLRVTLSKTNVDSEEGDPHNGVVAPAGSSVPTGSVPTS